MKPASARGLTRLIVCLVAAATLAGALAGCQRMAPVRTLPDWVRGIYIPIVRNESYEPAVEEQATQLIQEAFLADGQVGVVRKPDADATLLVKIKTWTPEYTSTSTDRFADRERVTVTASVSLVEPYDETSVIADLGSVVVPGDFNTDFRSVRYDIEPDRKEELLRRLADQVVFKTLTGFPQTVTPLGRTAPVPATSPQEIRSEDIVKSRPGGM